MGSIVAVTFDNGNIYHPEYIVHQCISDELKNEIKGSYENAHSLIYDTDETLKIFYTKDKGLIIEVKETRVNVKNDNSIKIENPNGDFIEMTNKGIINIKTSDQVNVDTKDITIKSSGDVIAEIKGKLEAKVTGDTSLSVKGKVSADIKGKLDVKCLSANVKASGNVNVDGTQILLGQGAVESVIKGNTFEALFNSHIHIGNIGVPTSPPVVPLAGAELSTKVKTA